VFLKSLTLKGFKSFADSTTLELEPGVTVVVGPNGSGKSNVVDAIAWVLGAQAPSSVRSQKMDDVIFAGSENRAALGRAEVELVLDNQAGILPIDFEEVRITRTLFRSGDSEYAINGVSCRLLDIQELLSDTGVGRQQHTIVSQGEIDAVLNARPEERRLIIEEAAGVLKFRRRKERSERRLDATEANLTRLKDLLREVRRQLRPLERQAEAARVHGDRIAELTALRTYIAGRELSSIRERLRVSATAKRDGADQESRLRTTLKTLDAEVIAEEAKLSAFGDSDSTDDLARIEALKERVKGMAALLAERSRGLHRDRTQLVSAEVVANLEAEVAAVRTELREAESALQLATGSAAEVDAAEADLAVEREALTEDQQTPGQAARTRGELAVLSDALERGRTEQARLASRLSQLSQQIKSLEAESVRLREEATRGDDLEAEVIAQLETAEATAATAAATLVDAETTVLSAEADRRHWTARADALLLALDEVRSRSGAEVVGGLEGALGTLLELVTVESGWEAAFEAAIGEAASAVVVRDLEAAQRALREFQSGDTSGAVLALSQLTSPKDPPPAGAPLRPHVAAADPDVARLLDSLVGAAVVVADAEAAIDAAVMTPGSVIVTTAGDRFGPGGWRVGVPRAGATGAALDEAVDRAESAVETLATAEADRNDAADRHGQTVAQQHAQEAKLHDLDQSRESAMVGLERIERDRREAILETEGLEARLSVLDRQVERDGARHDELEATLPALEQFETRSVEVASMRAQIDLGVAGLSDRTDYLSERLAGLEQRLAEHGAEAAEAGDRRSSVDSRIAAASALAEHLQTIQTSVDAEVDRVREVRRRQSDEVRAVAMALDGLRQNRAEAERSLTELRAQQAKLEVAEAELNIKLENLVEMVRRELDTEPATAMAAEAPEVDETISPAARVRDLERELRLMGPINPLALQEYDALNERHEFLVEQLEDVKASRRELNKIIRAVNDEIVSVFSAAYADVSENFEDLFTTLFPGGKGRLRLTDPSDLLATGIEVEAKPSGKNVKKLSLLSGGERSLTALAFLFAVFRSRPSPFYVMDEVEAALDDVNLHRFLDLLAEFREEAQLVVVSHQKRTMEAADCLYGVTMKPGGSSRVVSERVHSAA
jgi:chromosome segregation protein